MSMTQTLAPHLPYLRRYARALTGSQQSGDAHVRAALLTGDEALSEGVPPRVGLYRLFHAIWQSGAEHFDAEDDSGGAKSPENRLRALSASKRAALLLTAVEAFSPEEAAFIIDESPEEIEKSILDAQKTIDTQLASRVLIIEDEPIIAMDLENLVTELGHTVVAVAATKDEAVAKAHSERPGLVLADINLGEGGSGIDAVSEILSAFGFRHSGDLHHRLSGKAAHRRAAGADLSDRQALPARNRAGDGGPGLVLSSGRQAGGSVRKYFIVFRNGECHGRQEKIRVHR